ncbi:methionyl-tRNA synthetase cytoplasmic [Clonorchis sinensis]|uniref:Methionyl-tRNA synthetase cytoplasmic n=1 Tax=Clonorchis sinensis TaxID=79923 RepID=G7YX80_CLOSI|nr:methionyl-tRNA synthetase cytoplasmic [Clonorchis sinensis]
MPFLKIPVLVEELHSAACSIMKLASKIESIQSKIRSLRALASPEYISFAEDILQQENQALERKVDELKYKLCMAELLFGTTKTVESNNVKAAPDSPGKSKSAGGTKTLGKASGPTTAAEAAVDVGRLDMRIGRIVEVSRHPDADSLYVEKVDLGEGRLRTVVSGLVKFVQLEELQNRMGIFMCNLKPAKMRGVESEAMLMCASAPETGVVEPLVIGSEDVNLGDPVIVPGFEHNPDSQLNPKKKIFEQVKPDLRVDQDGYATYKGVRWTLKSSPSTLIKSTKLRDVQIA